MTETTKPDKPSKDPKADTPCDDSVETCPLAEKKYEVIKVEVKVDVTNNKIVMNDPAHKCVVTAVVTYKKSTVKDALDSLPDKVIFTSTDPGGNNTDKAASYKYSGSDYLGKKSHASAKYWEGFSGYSAGSDDSFHTNAKVTAKDLEPNKTLEAKVYMLPSGVGGNDYTVTATVYKADGTTELVKDTSSSFEVWRKVSFDNIYEMKGLTHVSTNATEAIISPVYTPAKVIYKVGSRTELTTAQSVKYIGLWKDSATPQKSWATVQSKTAAETPTEAEITDATHATASAKRTQARNAIVAKAQKWADRIDSAFSTDMRKWISDTALPANCLVGIQYYHPKFSIRGGDFATGEWKLGGAAVPAWLRVGAFQKSAGGHYYTGLDPDGLWVNWGGLSHGSGIVSVPSGIPTATTKQVVRHEAGHATKYFFKREDFGASLDHSVSQAGIMYKTTDGGTTFTSREKKILRGIKP